MRHGGHFCHVTIYAPCQTYVNRAFWLFCLKLPNYTQNNEAFLIIIKNLENMDSTNQQNNAVWWISVNPAPIVTYTTYIVTNTSAMTDAPLWPNSDF